MILKHLYTVFIAVLLVIFVGVGIAAFYKAPKYPEYPAESKPVTMLPTGEISESAEMTVKRADFDRESKTYQEKNELYSKNVSTISVIAALIILIISITLLSKIEIISDGLMMGGVFTLGYAITKGFGAGDEMFRFLVVSVGLFVAIFLGYWRFVRNEKKTK